MKKRQPISMWIMAWVELAQSVVVLLTLGFVQPEWRAKMLFSCDWLERLGEWELRR